MESDLFNKYVSIDSYWTDMINMLLYPTNQEMGSWFQYGCIRHAQRIVSIFVSTISKCCWISSITTAVVVEWLQVAGSTIIPVGDHPLPAGITFLFWRLNRWMPAWLVIELGINVHAIVDLPVNTDIIIIRATIFLPEKLTNFDLKTNIYDLIFFFNCPHHY